MPYYTKEQLEHAKSMDLLTYLKNYEPNELVKVSSNEYTTREHDSLRISNGFWNWCSAGIGGRNAVDYLTKVKNYKFIEAVEIILKNERIQAPIYEKKQVKKPRRINIALRPKGIILHFTVVIIPILRNLLAT